MTYGSIVDKLKSADEVIDQFKLAEAKKKFTQVPDTWSTASPENVNRFSSGIRNPNPRQITMRASKPPTDNPVLGFIKGVGQTAKSMFEPPKYIEGVPDWQKPLYYMASKQGMGLQMGKSMVDEYALSRQGKANQANKETLLNYIRDISYNIPEFQSLPLDKRLNAYAQYLGYKDSDDWVEKLTTQKKGKVTMGAATDEGMGLPELQTPAAFSPGVESEAKREDLTFEAIQIFMPMPSSAAMKGWGLGQFASKLAGKLPQAAAMLGKGVPVIAKIGGKSLAELGGSKIKQGTERALKDLEQSIPENADYPMWGGIGKTPEGGMAGKVPEGNPLYYREIERTVSGEKPLVLLEPSDVSKAEKAGLKIINTENTWGFKESSPIGYRPENEKLALELKRVLETASADDVKSHIRVGRLLGYSEKDIKEFVKDFKPSEMYKRSSPQKPIVPKEPTTSKSSGIKVETGKTIPTEEIKPPIAKAKISQPPEQPPIEPPTVVSGGDDYERLINSLGKEKTPLKERVESTKNKFLREFYDRNRPLKELENETGIPVHKLAQVVPGSTAAGEDILRVSYRPVLSKVQKDIKFLEQYMVLKRNEDILARNPKAKLPGGITNNTNAMTSLEKKIGTDRFKALDDVATELWKQNDDKVLKPLLDEGLISKAQYDAIRTNNPHYIPFQRADFVSDIEKSFVRPEANVSSTGLKKLSIEGSERALDNPLARLEAEVIKTQNIIFRNRAAKSIVTALQEAEKTTGNKLVKIVKEGGEHSNLVDTISYFENGKKITAEVPAIYAQVAKGMEWEANNVLTNVLNKASAPLRQGAVTYNPAFLPVNLVRDAMTAFFREKLIPLSPEYFRGWTGVIKKNALYSDAARSGAFMSGIVDTMRTTDAMRRVSMAGAITVKSPKDALLVLPRLVERANLMGEQATRLATFGKLRAQGLDTLEAAVRTRDVTVDFAKAGTTMRVINQIVPFSNAGVQGTANVLRVMKSNPKWAIVATAPFVAATILSRVNNMRWESSNLIPDYEYTNNWVVQIGEATNSKGETTPVYIKVPKGQIGSMLTFFPESLFNYNRKDNDKSVVENILAAGLEATKTASPVSTDISGLMPPLMGTGVGVATNVDPFSGRDIVPLGEQFDTPVTEQFGAETSSVAIALGKQFNVSPRLIDYAIKDYTAGTGELSMWLLDMGLGALGYNPQQDKEITDMPLEENLAKTPGVRRFLGTKNTRPYYLEKNKETDTTTPTLPPVKIPSAPKTTTTKKTPNYLKGSFKPFKLSQ